MGGGGASPFDLFCSPLSLSAGVALPLPLAPVAVALAASLLSFSFCFLFSFLLRSLSLEPFACDTGGSLGAGVAGLGVGAVGGAGCRTCCGPGAVEEGAGVGDFEGGPGVPTLDGGLGVGNFATPMGLPDGECRFGVVVPPTAGTGAGAA